MYRCNNCVSSAAYEMEAVIVPAGEACAGLCGDGFNESEEVLSTASLPNTIIERQVYTYSFCPSEALQRGTMFPELVG